MTPRRGVGALRDHVAQEIGLIAKPRRILLVAELPKTRSGKIMRRLLRDVAENREAGDVSTLADASVMALFDAGWHVGTGPRPAPRGTSGRAPRPAPRGTSGRAPRPAPASPE